MPWRQSGCRVAILDVQEEQGRKVAEDIGGVFIYCDVTSPESAEAAINAAREAQAPRVLEKQRGGYCHGSRFWAVRVW